MPRNVKTNPKKKKNSSNLLDVATFFFLNFFKKLIKFENVADLWTKVYNEITF